MAELHSHTSPRKGVTKPRSDASESIPKSPLRYYFSQKSTVSVRTNDLPLEQNAVGRYSPWGIFFILLGTTVPFAHIYILLILLRELCVNFPEIIYDPIKYYVPYLASIVGAMQQSSTTVEVWCVIEAIFFVMIKFRLYWLNSRDPLEASLSAAPMMEIQERQLLWDRMMDCENDYVSFVSGWFFDEPIANISKSDMRDWGTWSMFEGRNQEHLTVEELAQLDGFVYEFEYRISLQMHGEEEVDSSMYEEEKKDAFGPLSTDRSEPVRLIPFQKKDYMQGHPRPKKIFHFHDSRDDEPPNYFSNLYENYRQRYTQYRSMIQKSDFHPVQDFRNLMADTRQHMVEAEESAVATANHVRETVYQTLVSPGSNMDKQLSAIGHKTHTQMTEAWNSVLETAEFLSSQKKEVRQRLKGSAIGHKTHTQMTGVWNSVLETAEFLSVQKKEVRQRLKGYRVVLKKMRKMSSSVPSKQMAVLMRKITECNEALDRVEHSARDAFIGVTGYARKNILLKGKEPQRYAKFSFDPLLGVQTYPLMLHILVLSLTEGSLRILMKNRGFERLTVGRTSYYYHPGTPVDDTTNEVDHEDDENEEENEKLPLFFVHGIGVGLIVYMPLIDRLLKTGRPIILPELSFVSGFRPWQPTNGVLKPAEVTNTITAMLATHGYSRGVFLGHSYGTSWLSYMCKYAPNAVAAVLFLDPICFCLHIPRLTKQFVYHRPDPGNSAYMVRTDVMVNWTIQRSFPWPWMDLFVEEITVPCSVFLSEYDALVPAEKVEGYLRSKGAPVKAFTEADRAHFASGDINVTVLKGDAHGDWTEQPSRISVIGACVDELCARVTETR